MVDLLSQNSPKIVRLIIDLIALIAKRASPTGAPVSALRCFLLSCKVCYNISDILTLDMDNAKFAKLNHEARFRVAGRLLVVPKCPTPSRKQECG